jgi:lysine 2,3-aminomutase
MRAAVGRLVRAGIPVLSQSVLLRGVNDDSAVLEALFRGLVAMRVKPYYLHHPDLAPGTGHFRLDIADGQALVGALRGLVSGLCQPSYVLDIPGGYGKSPIGPNYIERIDGGSSYRVTDFTGREHRYPASQKLVADRHQVEQGGRQRQADKTDKHDRDHRVPNE